MTAVSSRATVALLIVINGLLLSGLLYELIGLKLAPNDVIAAVQPVVTELPKTNHKPVVKRSIDDYKAILNRPLFNKERRPVEITDSESTAEDEKAFNLVGIVLTPEQQVAIIYSKKQEKPQKVALWDWIEGWRLISVEANSVMLRKGTRSIELALQRASKTETKTETLPETVKNSRKAKSDKR